MTDILGTPAHAGKIRFTVTYLEMTKRPQRTPAAAPAGDAAIVQARRPPAHYYRYLFNTVGEPWLWTDRRTFSDENLAAIFASPAVSLFVLHVAGVPAGFVELRRIDRRETNVDYFGLMPDFVGQRFGPYLLDFGIDRAWDEGAAKVTVNTCTLDHPKALRLYQRAGFIPVRRRDYEKDDPRLTGVLPRHAAPQHPIVEA